MIIGMPIFIMLMPFMLVLLPINYFQRKKFEKKYAKFLNENNGRNFFCYNNRKNSKYYIEEKIIPNLADEIEIIYLKGKKVELIDEVEFISAALFKLKNYNRFPHLIKIRNGKLIDKSINNPFYNVLNSNKSKIKLLEQIHLFFDLTEIKNGRRL